MGIGGGSLDTPADALLGVAAWVGKAGAAFGCGSLGGAAVPAGVFIGPCCCAPSVADKTKAATQAKTVIAACEKRFLAGLNKMPPIADSSSCLALWPLCTLC